MTARYPSTLPAPLRAGKSRKQIPRFRVTSQELGRLYVQPGGFDTPVIWALVFRFTQAQAGAFIQWFTQELGNGASPFRMQIRTEFGFVGHELQFLPDGLLDCTEDGPLFTYKATVMARRLVIPDEFLQFAPSIISGARLRSMVVDTNNIVF